MTWPEDAMAGGSVRQAAAILATSIFAAAVVCFAAQAAPSRASSISIPVRLADDADALMMGGTGMLTPDVSWMDSIITDYLDPATGNRYSAVPVTTPETFPVAPSITGGLADLQAAMAQQQATDPGAPYIVEGYSQSTWIVVAEEEDLAAMVAAGQPIPDVTLAMLASANRPDGGLFERFPGFYMPGFESDFNGAEPTNAGVQMIDIANQYDPLGDFPEYPINLVADLNSVLGFLYAHSAYGEGAIPGLTPASEPMTGPYASEYLLGSTEIVKQVDGDTTFYFIPTTDLPLLDPLRSLGVPESWLNIVQPALQVIVEAGYDRSIPFGDPTPAELIPSIDPITFLLELANGVVQGANNAFELFGAQLPDFSELESFFASAESWSETNVGVPYDQVVTDLNTAFDPFTLFTELEGPIGQDIQDLFNATGIQGAISPLLGGLIDAIEPFLN